MANLNKNKIAFLGTPQFAVTILEELKKAGIVPALVITAPDRPQGRGLAITAPPVKVWAQENKIKVIQPMSLKINPGNETSEIDQLFSEPWDLFIVAAYGKILPENILEIPKYGALNVHPSLLPKYRGSSPIEAAILHDDREIGVSIMRLDKEMDHGPIVAQEKIPAAEIATAGNWPVSAPTLEDIAAYFGGALLAKTIPDWLDGKIKEKEQDHSKATYCQKITKADGLVDLTADPRTNYLKICAYSGWPGAYFFQKIGRSNDMTVSRQIRVSIKKTAFADGQLTIQTVTPEGKNEMSYLDFLRGIK